MSVQVHHDTIFLHFVHRSFDQGTNGQGVVPVDGSARGTPIIFLGHANDLGGLQVSEQRVEVGGVGGAGGHDRGLQREIEALALRVDLDHLERGIQTVWIKYHLRRGTSKAGWMENSLY